MRELVHGQSQIVLVHTHHPPRSEPEHSYCTAIDVVHRLPIVMRRRLSTGSHSRDPGGPVIQIMRWTSGSPLVREIMCALIVIIAIGLVLSVEILF